MTVSTANGGKVYVSYVDQWLDTLAAADSEEEGEVFQDDCTSCRQRIDGE